VNGITGPCRERVVVNDCVTEVKKQRVRDINTDIMERALNMRVKSGILKLDEGSRFRGFRVAMKEIAKTMSALHAIYAYHRTARAAHNIYAYRI